MWRTSTTIRASAVFDHNGYGYNNGIKDISNISRHIVPNIKRIANKANNINIFFIIFQDIFYISLPSLLRIFVGFHLFGNWAISILGYLRGVKSIAGIWEWLFYKQLLKIFSNWSWKIKNLSNIICPYRNTKPW